MRLENEIHFLVSAKNMLSSILGNIPALTTRWVKELHFAPEINQLVDFTLEVQYENRVYPIVVVFRRQGFPQLLEQAIAQLIRFQYKVGARHELMVVAPFITPEGAEICRKDDVSYFDLAGNCRIAFGLVYLERTGAPNPFQKNAIAAPSLYGMRGERILRTLLQNPAKPWKVVEMMKQVGVSAGTVSTIRQQLIERDWAKDTAAGILLTQPEKLLKDWAVAWSKRACRPHAYFSRLPVAEFEKQAAAFAEAKGRRLAFTGAAAAWRYAPMTRYQRAQVYWDGEPDELAQALQLKPTEGGANVHILTPRDRGVFDFGQTLEGVPVVGSIQTYLDLQRDPARGEEAAEHLWRTVLFHV